MPTRLVRPKRLLLTGLLAAVATAIGPFAVPPASADPASVATVPELEARLQDASDDTAVLVRLDQDLVSRDFAEASIAIPDGGRATLDLHGHELDLQQLTVGANASLDVVDSASGGSLEVGPSSSASDDDQETGIAIDAGATMHVTGARVSATGSDAGRTAGIGSPAGTTSLPGRLVVTDRASVTGQGGKGGAGIGGAQGAAAIAVSVLDSRLVGRGGLGGAGIGSGRSGVSFGGLTSSSTVTQSSDVGDYSRYASSIDGAGGRGAAGIGGGLHASGGPVRLDGNTDANVSTSGAVTGASGTPSVVGAGQAPVDAAGSFGTLRIGRHAWLWANNRKDVLIVPADAQVRNDGAIRALGGVIGDGTIDNHGVISSASSESSPSAGTDPAALITVGRVTGHNYLLDLHVDGGAVDGPAEVHVLCTYLDPSLLPSATSAQSGRTLMAWNTRADGTGEDFTGQSLEDLTGDESEDGTPVTLHLYARFGATPRLTASAMPDAALGEGYDQPLPVAGDGITGVKIVAQDEHGDEIPTLPAGLRYDAATGRVRGEPTESGDFRFRVVTTGRAPVDGYLRITVAGAPVLTADALPIAQEGTPYTASLSSRGAGTVSWSLLEGALPDGLSLSTSGVLSGTPSGRSSSTFTLQASNEYGSAARSFTLVVEPRPVAETPTTTPAAIATTAAPVPTATPTDSPLASPPSSAPAPTPSSSSSDPSSPSSGSTVANAPAPVLDIPQRVSGRLGHRLVIRLATAGGGARFSTRGDLPPGVRLDAEAGELAGVPLEPGTFLVTVTATTSGGSASATITVVVPEPRELLRVDGTRRTWTATRPMPVRVTGVREGERYRVLVDDRTVRTGTVRRSGVLSTEVRFRATGRDTVHRVRIVTDRTISDPGTIASTSFRVTALAPKKTLRLASRTEGGARTILVHRLAAAEHVEVEVDGRSVASGHADGTGTFSFSFRRWRAGTGTHHVVVTGGSEHRTGALTIRSPHR